MGVLEDPLMLVSVLSPGLFDLDPLRERSPLFLRLPSSGVLNSIFRLRPRLMRSIFSFQVSPTTEWSLPESLSSSFPDPSNDPSCDGGADERGDVRREGFGEGFGGGILSTRIAAICMAKLFNFFSLLITSFSDSPRLSANIFRFSSPLCILLSVSLIFSLIFL